MRKVKRLFKMILSKTQKKIENQDEIYFHEDSYCQVELIPRENLSNLTDENKKIIDFGMENSVGIGFSDIYIRDDNKFKTSIRQIQVKDFEKILLNIGFEKRDFVYTGYGSHKEKCSNTNAYVIDKAVMFCDFKEEIIQNIWIDGFRFNSDSKFIRQMVSGLNEIGIKWDLILNDWDVCQAIDIQDKNQIEIYIKEI
jgi:hypothetical protein